MTAPIAIHTNNRTHVASGRLTISSSETAAAAMGTAGTHGVRNGRSRFGCVRRSTITPIETTTKANNVPILTS